MMVLETVKGRYKNKTRGYEFKCFNWWEAMRHQLKWRAKSVGSFTTNPWIFSSDHAIEEEVAHPIDQDRAKAAA
jgi:hypothetical protein